MGRPSDASRARGRRTSRRAARTGEGRHAVATETALVVDDETEAEFGNSGLANCDELEAAPGPSTPEGAGRKGDGGRGTKHGRRRSTQVFCFLTRCVSWTVVAVAVAMLAMIVGSMSQQSTAQVASTAVLANLPETVAGPLREALDALGNTLSVVNSTNFDGVGQRLATEGVRAHHPLIFIPGIVSTGLHLWEGRPCAASYFRSRIWGTTTMFASFMTDKHCWLDHICLTAEGKDPSGVRVRAAESLEAADYLFPGFWVWGKLIANLARVGYDSNSMFMASYDWRLSLSEMQARDGYFSKLKSTIELAYELNDGVAPVVMGHSLGGNVMFYFLKWWVDTYIEAVVPIAAPLLGVPKAVASLASGEMRNSAHMGMFEGLLLDKVFARTARMRMFRSWFSVAVMLPKGGSRVWGSAEAGAPDDLAANATFPAFNVTAPASFSLAPMLRYKQSSGEERVYYADDLGSWFSELAPGWWERVTAQFSLGDKHRPVPGESPEEHAARVAEEPGVWSNVLETPLPVAPTTKIYCLYGTGLPAERTFHYRDHEAGGEPVDDDAVGGSNATAVRGSGENVLRREIDIEATERERGLLHGVQDSLGDGTVPLISLGLMCADLWRRDEYNPGKMPVVTREYEHVNAPFDPRGGPGTADHVDLLGNSGLIEDILRIAAHTETGAHPLLDERIVSPIREMASAIEW
ncbi:Phospholipid:diacylglycerol acyltransferase [Thecamonas trahens ATCC 50062]|uniref:Phospholipid:diacylglycerol acyltransferase n=1 Tax=Thecamonas trahens ATCC 50062 TaxID=461836 RepID=A0A0L0DD79_THETB|nr:Phospholipid:diacylglycerol acyltransferase [Thecamonas trahens ATCC 50062]KNC50302.1 Phospholipid:diacylglycerol acyltransferase [Thecamonas trahens ATCC 50062]|eukprot:XP_013756849.1 Phospholipid:diacylglycerol acyltransferase [Thecamonas trahens ATCC 50062]